MARTLLGYVIFSDHPISGLFSVLVIRMLRVLANRQCSNCDSRRRLERPEKKGRNRSLTGIFVVLLVNLSLTTLKLPLPP
jgi:hypothetical protein